MRWEAKPACAAIAVQLAGLDSQSRRDRSTTVRTIDGFEAATGEALVQFRDPATASRQRGPLAAYVDAEESATVPTGPGFKAGTGQINPGSPEQAPSQSS